MYEDEYQQRLQQELADLKEELAVMREKFTVAYDEVLAELEKKDKALKHLYVRNVQLIKKHKKLYEKGRHAIHVKSKRIS